VTYKPLFFRLSASADAVLLTIVVISNTSGLYLFLERLLLFLKDYIENSQLVVHHTSTENMIADMLTKPLPAQQFIRLRDKLLGYTAWTD
jgi:hypothetical protein